MSYYRRADGTQPTSSSITSPQLLTPPPNKDDTTTAVIEALLSPRAVSQPVQCKDIKASGKKRAGMRVRAPVNDANAWAETMCCYRPFGKCPRPQTYASVYCTFHTCNAFNGDKTRCPNLVEDPTKERICREGYHHENKRYAHILELENRRKRRNQEDARNREEEHNYHVNYFAQHFSAATSTSSMYTTSSRSSDTSTRHTSPSPDRGEPLKWDCHYIDQQWEEHWRQSPTGSTGSANNSTVNQAIKL